jgi:hypothetical protein
MHTTGLHHVAISVKELEPAVRFYADVMGFEQIDRPDFGFPGAWFQAGDHQIHLMEMPDAAPDRVRQQLAAAPTSTRRSQRSQPQEERSGSTRTSSRAQVVRVSSRPVGTEPDRELNQPELAQPASLGVREQRARGRRRGRLRRSRLRAPLRG